MPAWIIQFLVQALEKFITPDVVAQVESWAKQFACCELKRMASSTPTEIDDAILAKVAEALGVDLSKCPA